MLLRCKSSCWADLALPLAYRPGPRQLTPQVNSTLGRLMNSLHESLLTGYEVDGARRTIVLRTEPHHGDGVRAQVRFSGVLAYHLEGDCLKNIIFDVNEVPSESIVGDGEAFAERHRGCGWPEGWDPKKEPPEQFLRRNGCRCFSLTSSYGIHGWIAAERMEIVTAAEASGT